MLNDASGQNSFGPVDPPYLIGTLRDFRAVTSPGGHPDFEMSVPNAVVIEAVAGILGPDGLPVFNNPVSAQYSGGVAFDQWYRDTPGTNLSQAIRVELTDACPGSTTYLFRRSQFFPLDGKLFGNEGREHNYHFTCELHAEFTATGADFINTSSDDDLWIFVNGQRVIDLGGRHTVTGAGTNLNAAALGLVPGSTTNRLDIFFAERRTSGSALAIETNLKLHAPGTPEPVAQPPNHGLSLVQWAVSSGNWENPANWSPARVPGAGDLAIICNGGTAVLNTPTNVGGLFIGSGTLTHSQGNTNGVNLTVITTIHIAGDGRLDVSEAGYLGGGQPGNPFGISDIWFGQTRGAGGLPAVGSGNASGGSYGSLGGGASPNPIYGSATAPVDLGSGGAGWRATAIVVGGNGGGRMHVRAQSLLVDGVLRANGERSWDRGTGATTAWGGGSGGSIFVELSGEGFSGSGLIEAKGGPSADPNHFGGGGRIAVVGYASNSFAGTLGRAGTVFTQAASPGGHLQLDGTSLTIAADTTNTFSSFSATTNGGTIYNYGTLAMADDTLVIGPGVSLLQHGVVKGANRPDDWIGSVTVQSNGVIWHAQGFTNGLQLKVAGPIQVLAGGRLDVSAAGYLGGGKPENIFGRTGQTRGVDGLPAAGAGVASFKASGGSYGSLGGAYAPNPLYGSATAPVDLGSGGAGDSCCSRYGGNGGGRIHLRAQSLLVDGVLRANGERSYNGGTGATDGYGGGSGGSIFVELSGGSFSGSGVIEAKGGPSLDIGIGGGGRISISGYSTTQFTSTGNGLTGFKQPKFSGTINSGTVYKNARPLPSVQTNRFIAELSLLVVTNTATDLDASNLIAYTLLAAPPGATISTNGIITWETSETTGPSTNTFTTMVQDNALVPLSATNTFTVVVNEINVPPVLSALANTNVNELTTLTLTNTAVDSDIPVNSLSYALIEAPDGATIDTNGVIVWTPTEGQGPGTNTFTTVVTDTNIWAVNTQSFTVTNTFTVVVNEVNVPPELFLPASTNIDELVAYAANATATDADIPLNALTFALVSGPAGLTVSPTGRIEWTPDEGQGPGTNTVIIRVTDLNPPAVNEISFSVTNSYQIVVNEVNVAPVLPVLADTNILELTTLVVTNTATDSDLPANPLTYLLLAAPAGAVIDTNGVITWIPTEEQGPSTNLFATVVTDTNQLALNAQSLSTTNTFTVVVGEVNVAPLLTLPANTNVSELVPFTALATATDADLPQNPLTFALVSGPAGLTVSPEGTIDWLPAENQGPGTHLITISVTDTNPLALNLTSLSVTSSFEMVVHEVNVAPVLTVPADQIIIEQTLLSVAASAVDADLPANDLRFALVSPPAGLTIDPVSGAITWTPDESQGPGSYTITVTVTDTNPPALNALQFSVTNHFTVTVLESNRPPVLSLPPDLTIPELAFFSTNVLASDPDLPAGALTFALISGPSNLTVSAGGVIAWRPAEAQGPGTHVVTISVTDTNPLAVDATSLSVTGSFQIVVEEVNAAPALPEQADRVMDELTLLTVTNTATDADLPANGLAYALLQAPANAAIDTNGVITWTPTEEQGPSTNLFTTVVTDTNGLAFEARSLSATNSFRVVVHEINTAPDLIGPGPQTLHAHSVLLTNARATDLDWPDNQLTFERLDGPAALAISPDGVILWTPGDSDAPSTNTVRFRVFDSGLPSLSVTQSFSVTVVGRPVLAGPVLVGSNVVLRWTAVDGIRYRVEESGEVSGTNWTEWSNEVTAAGPMAATTNSLARTNRFLRVRVLP